MDILSHYITESTLTALPREAKVSEMALFRGRRGCDRLFWRGGQQVQIQGLKIKEERLEPQLTPNSVPSWQGSKGGQKHAGRHLGGGGGMHIVNFEGLKFLRGAQSF